MLPLNKHVLGTYCMEDAVLVTVYILVSKVTGR